MNLSRNMQVSVLLFLSIITLKTLFAGNPIVPYVGMADPHIHIFNNRAYLYATRDADSTAKDFVMPEWNIWSSGDLINWTLERTIYPTETYMGESTSCWAADIAYNNGYYYFYFSNGNVNTGVMKGTSPSGPFVDALGKPLLHEDLTIGKEYDPTVLVDDDQTAYLVFGHHRSYEDDKSFYIVKLNEDMISMAEHPREIQIIHGADVDTIILRGNDKPNLHKRNGIYYLSAGAHYATSESVYGPYTTRGNTGNNKFGLDSRAHGNFFQWNNQWFHSWCFFHLGRDVARYRESYISYLHYKENGEMVTDTIFLENHFETGVGQYDATWDRIEAEWFMAASGISKRESPNGGFEIQNIQNNGYLFYPNVKNLDQARSMTFYLSSVNGGTIEVRGNDLKGPLLGSVKVPSTGGWFSYENLDVELETHENIKDIYMVFKGQHDTILHLDWFNFQNFSTK
jgi:arabinoxylan arabinofuranohydrolase